MDTPYMNFKLYPFLKENDFSADVYLSQAEKTASCLYWMQNLITGDMVRDAGASEAQRRLESVHSKVQSIAFWLDILRQKTPKSFMLCVATFNARIMRLISEVMAALKGVRH